MDNEIHFRSLLIKIQDRLSESDRRRFHFLFGDIIPRILRDDLTVNGTLNLFESLFDQNIINDQHFQFLIQSFQEIHCYDIAQRLQSLLDTFIFK